MIMMLIKELQRSQGGGSLGKRREQLAQASPVLVLDGETVAPLRALFFSPLAFPHYCEKFS